MSLQNDPRYFPQPDVPTNGDYGQSFGREQLYQAYLPRSPAADTANETAVPKIPSKGKYVFDPATGQYTWVPATATTGTGMGMGLSTVTDNSNRGNGSENGSILGSNGNGYGQGFTGSTTNGSPSTGLASGANSLAAMLGNMGLTGISDAIAKQVSPNYGNEGRNYSTPIGSDQSAAETGRLARQESNAVGGDGESGGRDFSHGDSSGNSGGMATGGLSDLGGYSDGGRLLRGPGDGVSDSIPANIGGKRPARLADGEFVVPARIVSELGNGSTEAGARKLYAMLDRIQAGRKKSIGKGKVATNSRMDKNLPA